MNRQEIKQKMCSDFVSNEHIKKIYGLTDGKTFEQEFSIVSLENIIFDVISGVVAILHRMFNRHKYEVEQSVARLKPHSIYWYYNKIKNFQYGFKLLPESDVYDNQNYTTEQIDNSKIIKYCAITELQNPSKLIVKVATELDSKITRLDGAQKESFKKYLAEVKDAGVAVDVISFSPDKVRLKIRIVRDKLILSLDGKHKTNGNYPVNDALITFFQNLPFDGELSKQKLIDRLLQVDGVVDLAVDEIMTSKVSASTSEVYEDYTSFDISVIANSGYFEINLTEENEDKTEIVYE